MKKLMILIVCLILTQAAVQAQVKFGIKAGISTPDIKPADLSALGFRSLNKLDSFTLKATDANYGFHAGGWLRLKLGAIYLQPEVLFNTSTVQYSLKQFNSTSLDTLRKERLNNIDVPLLLGFKLGSFRVNIGPVAHIHLNSTTNLTQLSEYKESFQSASWGYQGGIGLDFGKLGLDLRYEGNFSNFGDHITFAGKSYSFSKTPSRMTLSTAISF